MLQLTPSVSGLFKGRQFEPEVILLAVGWSLRFSLSYREVEELLAERALPADHVTVWRWAQRYAPETERTLLAPISTAVDSCVSAKLSLDAPGYGAVFVSSAKPGSAHPGLLAVPQLQRPDFLARVQSKAAVIAIHSLSPSFAAVPSPSLTDRSAIWST